MKILYIFFVIILFFSFSCRSDRQSESGTPPSMSLVRKYFGYEYIDRIIETEAMIFLKITPQFPSDFIIDEKKTYLSNKEVSDIKKILLNDSDYLFELEKRTLFIPEFALEIPDKEPFIILFSPTSKEVSLFSETGKTMRVNIDPSFDRIMEILSKYYDRNGE